MFQSKISRTIAVIASLTAAVVTVSAHAAVEGVQARTAKMTSRMDLQLRNPKNLVAVPMDLQYLRAQFEVKFSTDGGTDCTVTEVHGDEVPCVIHTYSLDRMMSNYATAAKISVRVSDLFKLFENTEPMTKGLLKYALDDEANGFIKKLNRASDGVYVELNFEQNPDLETVLGATRLVRELVFIQNPKKGGLVMKRPLN